MKRLLQITLNTYIKRRLLCICSAVDMFDKPERAKLDVYIHDKYTVARDLFSSRKFENESDIYCNYWWEPNTGCIPINYDPRVNFLNHLINELPDEKDEFVITTAVG